MKKVIKILDIQVPADKVVQAAIAKKAGFSNGYFTELIQGKKTSPTALQKIRKAILDIYDNGNIITYVPNYKDNDAKGKKILKKTA